MELKFPVDEDGPFPSSSSITERFLPPGLKSAFIAFSNLTLIYFWPILNWDNFNQLSATSVDGSLMEQKGWWCRFSFFLDNVGHLWPDTITTVMWDKQSPLTLSRALWKFWLRKWYSMMVAMSVILLKTSSTSFSSLPRSSQPMSRLTWWPLWI